MLTKLAEGAVVPRFLWLAGHDDKPLDADAPPAADQIIEWRVTVVKEFAAAALL